MTAGVGTGTAGGMLQQFPGSAHQPNLLPSHQQPIPQMAHHQHQASLDQTAGTAGGTNINLLQEPASTTSVETGANVNANAPTQQAQKHQTDKIQSGEQQPSNSGGRENPQQTMQPGVEHPQLQSINPVLLSAADFGDSLNATYTDGIYINLNEESSSGTSDNNEQNNRGRTRSVSDAALTLRRM
ncbi:unnamed protein product, partial [Amoebophrya sp. A120]|eukprot:GSA120T00022904001.1